jgi:DNA-directed RNA polymerase subunit RPC12/RpoP
MEKEKKKGVEIKALKKIGRLKEVSMKTPQHCPSFEVLGEVESLLYRCLECGERIEVLTDELDKKHVCPKCGKQIDFMKGPHYLYSRGRTAASC